MDEHKIMVRIPQGLYAGLQKDAFLNNRSVQDSLLIFAQKALAKQEDM